MKPEPMLNVFSRRPGRFALLDKGCARAGWTEGGLRLLEVGCAYGDASAYLACRGFSMTGLDLEAALVKAAEEKYCGLKGCRFFCGDATALPVLEESFDGIFSEAAFSVLRDKPAAALEYGRVLTRGGRVLINDFARQKGGAAQKEYGIPCIDGALTMEGYERIFSDAGFRLLAASEEFFAFAGIFALLCREYGVKPGQAGDFLTENFGCGRTDGLPAMTYCQMIFEKV